MSDDVLCVCVCARACVCRICFWDGSSACAQLRMEGPGWQLYDRQTVVPSCLQSRFRGAGAWRRRHLSKLVWPPCGGYSAQAAASPFISGVDILSESFYKVFGTPRAKRPHPRCGRGTAVRRFAGCGGLGPAEALKPQLSALDIEHLLELGS